MKKAIIFILIISAVTGFSQRTIEATVSSTSVTTYERFNYEITVNNNECNVSPPNFGDLTIVGGPYTSQSSSFTSVNGQRTQSFETKWTYTLEAKKKGNYTISAAKMICGDETQETESITISVGGESQQPSVDKDFFMRLSSNKSSVYEGEPFIASLKYYSRLQPQSFETLELGDATGIYRRDLNPDRTNFKTGTEIRNGVRYYTIELREELCFAQRHGKVQLEPYFTSLIVSRDFFNRYRKETYSNPLEMTIKKIPGSDHPDFNGLVGSFEVKGELSHDQVKMGEAIDITISIEGNGNMHDLGNVALDIPSEFDEFDPDIEEATKATRKGIGGKITYNFVVIPKHYGSYTIPGYSFTYFDLESEKMRTIQTQDFNIEVAKRPGVDIDRLQEVPSEEKSIRYIDEKADALFSTEDFFFGSWGYWFLILGPFGIVLLLVFIKRKKENRSDAEIQELDKRQILKKTKVKLNEAKTLLESGDQSQAQRILQIALEEFFMTKLQMQRSEQSQNSIESALINKGITSEIIRQYRDISTKLEMAQYAPITNENLSQTITDAENLFYELDKNI